MRGVRGGAGRGAGRAGGQLLRPGRAFAAGDAAGQPGPGGAGRRAGGPGGVRGADPGGAGAAAGERPGAAAGAAGGAGAAGAGAVVVRAAAAVVPGPAGGPVGDRTTSRWRCGWTGSWMPAALAAALARCGRPARGAAHGVPARRAGSRASRSWTRRRCGWSLPVVAVGARTSVARAVAAAAAEPFDLAARCRCGRGCCGSAPGEHVLVVVVHHIAGDGWSMGAAGARPVGGVCGAAGGAGAGLGAAAGAVRRLRAVAAGAAGRRGRPGQPAGRSAGLLAAGAGRVRRRELALPADRPRPAVASHRGACGARSMSGAGCMRGLAALARRARGDAVHGGAGGGWRCCCPGWARGRTSRSASPVAGRTDEALDELVGFFVNTLVLRTDLSGDPAFAELLGRVREAGLGAFAIRMCRSSGWWRRWPRPGRWPRHPLFQVMVALQNNAAGGAGPARPGGAARVPAARAAARFDLDVQRWPRSPARRDAGRAARHGDVRGGPVRRRRPPRRSRRGWCGCWRAVAAEPRRPAAPSIEVLDAAERAQLLAGLERHRGAGAGGHVAGLFEAQAARVAGCGGGGVRGSSG